MTRQDELNMWKASTMCFFLAWLITSVAYVVNVNDTDLDLKKEVVLDTPTAWCSVNEDGVNFRYVDKR